VVSGDTTTVVQFSWGAFLNMPLRSAVSLIKLFQATSIISGIGITLLQYQIIRISELLDVR